MLISDAIWGRKHQLSAGSCLAHSCHAWIFIGGVSKNHKIFKKWQLLKITKRIFVIFVNFMNFREIQCFGSCPKCTNCIEHVRLISCPRSFRNCPRCQLSHFSCYIRILIGRSILPEPWIPSTYGYLGLRSCDQIQPDPEVEMVQEDAKAAVRFMRMMAKAFRSTCTAWRSAKGFWMFLETTTWCFVVKS